ncbi:hypothetical protein EZS27_033991 [termite gut metagenome]|uniref:Fibrobacter succinogenes major paralogous domain-containing protein n=1 Tax=termite gut metagenome TaxID=433724 RepID=A0A5J4Q3V7_9ZZZZ
MSHKYNRQEATVYSIVKIGLQYWMGENLRTSRYIDGSSIELGKDGSNTPPDPFHWIKEDSYYYNSEAVNSGKLSPAGWKIANDDSWTTLYGYVGGNVSVLKSVSGWQGSYLSTNLSGFNAFPVGLYNKTNLYAGKYVAFWSMKDDDPNTVSKSVMLKFDSDQVEESANVKDLGLCIRCLRL